MKDVPTETLTEWIDLELDGDPQALDPAARAALRERLACDSSLAARKTQCRALFAGLAESRIAVREGFRDQVMSALPAASWEPRGAGRSIPSWALPAAMIAGLAIAAAVLVGGSAASSPILGTGAAIVDFLAATLLAGAGLAAASWRGIGLALEELVAQSGLSLVAMGAVVLCLNLLLFSLLRRRPAPDETPAKRGES